MSTVVGVLDQEDNNRLTIVFNDNKMLLKNDRLEVVHEFDYKFEHNLDVDINGVYLLAMITNFVGKTLEICFIDNNRPLIFRDKENIDNTALLMLLRRR